MANKKIEKTPLDKDWFKRVVEACGTSIKDLFNSDPVKGIGWSERTLFRAFRDKEISPQLLDTIAERLGVEPGYLAGNYAWTLRVCADLDDDGQTSAYFFKTFLKPSNYPYINSKQKSLGTYQHFLNTLMMHGVSEDDYKALPQDSRRRIFSALDTASTNVLKGFFSDCQKMEHIDYMDAFSWESEIDVIEAVLPFLEARGLVTISLDDE